MDSPELSGAWATTRLWQIDTRATARLTLRPAHSSKCWLLEQGVRPVGVIERTPGGDRFRTISEEWRAKVCRPARHVGWHLEFMRVKEAQPALLYDPRTVLSGGRLAVAVERMTACVVLCCGRTGALRPDRGADRPDRVPAPQPRRHRPHEYVCFGDKAADEPLLPVVMLAASVAILVHADQPIPADFGP